MFYIDGQRNTETKILGNYNSFSSQTDIESDIKKDVLSYLERLEKRYDKGENIQGLEKQILTAYLAGKNEVEKACIEGFKEKYLTPVNVGIGIAILIAIILISKNA